MTKQPTGAGSETLLFHVEAAGSSHFLQAVPCVDHWMSKALHILTNHRSHLGNRKDVIMSISGHFLVGLASIPVISASFPLAVRC